LHGIRTLLVVDHGDCGALGIAYGQRVLDDKKLELAAHMADAKRLQEELAVRHPDMDLQVWFIDRDAQGSFTQWKSLIPGPVIS
jgi:carbonic anhydrase